MSTAGTMLPPDARSGDRTIHYTMKTPRGQSASSHSHSLSHSSTSSQTYRPNKSSTPMASPRMPHSVGQPYPPKLSPSTAARITSQAQDSRTPSPSYFGLTVDSTNDPRDSVGMPRSNWSPPTSSVKSFGAAFPQQLPLDANPEFEAFKRQADANRGGSTFSLSGANFGRQTAGTPQPVIESRQAGPSRPRPPRWHTHGSDAPSEVSISTSRLGAPTSKFREREPSAMRMDVDTDSNSCHDSAYVSSESKRNSEASLNPPSFLNMPRYESPANFESPFDSRNTVSNVEDRHPRLSVMQGKADRPSETGTSRYARADTEPAKLEARVPSLMRASQLRDILEGPEQDCLLLLDVRVATHYSQSRIRGALNLCIPTTLLKRATFNLHKLQQTFQSEDQQGKFAAWREKEFLVVYDSSSSDKRDAVAAMNMLKKFTNEGYIGKACVLRDGFNGFATSYPYLIDQRSGAELSSSPALSLSSDTKRRPTLPPVIGGVMLPSESNNPNPFFSNIRQNVDLADGVGQMDVNVPPNLDMPSLPQWLRSAADSQNHGKNVSDKFLSIEKAEQARMKDAYSVFDPANAPNKEQVQLSGIEKGVKNRYKDILPFEHARVKLEGRSDGDCDYVNASHINAARSHKRYIASQGPLPATFEDFWSMVWDQDVRVVVMLTAESEGGQLKCHAYWTSKEYGTIKLRSLSEKKVSLDIDKHRSNSTISSVSSGDATPLGSAGDIGRRRANTTTNLQGSTPAPVQPALTSSSSHGETPYVIIRKFALSHTAHPFAPIREITHLHYPSWPDFGAPAQPSQLLALVELANVMQRAALPLDVSTIASSSEPSSLSRTNRPKNESAPLSWYDEPEADANARPMLVHCSAGCGRTGTFCTVDSVIDMLKRQRMLAVKRANAAVAAQRRQWHLHNKPETDSEGDVEMEDSPLPDEELVSPMTSFQEPATFPKRRTGALFSAEILGGDRDEEEDRGLDLGWLDDDSVDLIAKTVENFRGQRLSMVQSLRQFVLCYETVIEWVWRLQERAGAGAGGKGRTRSGSLQVQRS